VSMSAVLRSVGINSTLTEPASVCMVFDEMPLHVDMLRAFADDGIVSIADRALAVFPHK